MNKTLLVTRSTSSKYPAPLLKNSHKNQNEPQGHQLQAVSSFSQDLLKKDPTQFRFTSDLYKSFTYLHWVFFHRSKQMWRWLLFLVIKCVMSKCLFLGCQVDSFIRFCCQSCFDKPRNRCTSCSLPGILTATSWAQGAWTISVELSQLSNCQSSNLFQC